MNALTTIPDHELLRPIGRGSYGEVWLARNVMGAMRAVKIIWRQHFQNERPFEREFAGIQRYEPVSRSADGLVHVLHVGRNDAAGYFYYVMELADSVTTASYQPRTLRSDLKQHTRLPTADCLRLALDVVSGLAQLHRRDLVHRDVKPGNIIYVHGRAKLADLGLVSTGGEGHTFVGTEGYIPPEGPGTPAADLYGLGISLYEASTGFAPDRFPDIPTKWLREQAGEAALEFHEIILKACEGARERRYQRAEEMQADLALLQSGQSVRHVRALERRAIWGRRFAWVAAVVVTVAVMTSLIAHWRARVAGEISAKEHALRTRAEAAERDAQNKLYGAYLAQARATVVSGEMGRRFRTLEAVRQAAAIYNRPELRREAFAALSLADLRVERQINLKRKVVDVTIDPQGARCAVSYGRAAVEIHSLSDEGLLQTLPASTNLNAHLPRFSPDGRYLALKRDHSGGSDADLEVWSLVRTQCLVLARHGVAHAAFSFHPKEPRLLAGRPSGRLVTWDLEQGAEVASWRLPPHWQVQYSPEGNRFAVSYDKNRWGIVEVRDATNGAVLASAAFSNSVYAVSWHPDGRRIAVPCADGSVSLVDVQDGTVRLLGWHKVQATGADFSPEGNFVFSTGWDREANIWNVRNSQRELTAALGNDLAWTDGQRAALVLQGDRLQLLEFSRGVECSALPGELNVGVRRGKFSDDGRWVALPTVEGVVLWDLAGASPPAVLTVGGQGGVFFAPSGDELFSYGDRNMFRWRFTPAAESNGPPRLESLPVFQPRPPLYSALLLARRSAIVISDGEGLRIVALTNAATGEGTVAKWPVGRITVSADEQWLAAALERSFVRVFFLDDLALAKFTLTNGVPVRRLAFAPHTHRLVVMGDTCLEAWNAETWRLESRHSFAVDSFGNMSFSPDGRMLLVTENARTAWLLDADTFEPRLPLPVWTHPLAMSADGRRLVLSVNGRRAQLWDLAAVRERFRELGIDWQE